ncbi:tRNA-dihydrouridine synthase [Planctomycetales bacterium]|nr:tRNA-dihydrouridine synthase [Planctomycetales bacterium]
MAGYTHYAFRELLRFFGGVDLIATEMISARSFVELDIRGADLPNRLWGIKEERRPLAVQIWDNNPDTLEEFARRLAEEYKVSVIDLNFGCPAKQIAGKSASGSFLLQFPERIGDLVNRVVKAANGVPVTAKIRLGKTRDTINAADVAQAVEDAGADGLTVHGRTAADMYRGKADWEEIAKIKPKLKKIRLIGNGDITTVEEAVFRLQSYPVDGIMIGRGCVTEPWIFRQIRQTLNGERADTKPAGEQIYRIIAGQFSVLNRQFKESVALALLRKMCSRYSDGHTGARKFRNALCSAKTSEAFLKTVQDFFCNGVSLSEK